jgi:hypothetical protein
MSTITITETDRKIADMLVENTGSHFLDSGGAYGRNWERNAGKTVEDFMREPEATVDKWACPTLSAFHFLRQRLDFLPDEQALFDRYAAVPHREREGWLDIMQGFAEARQKAMPVPRWSENAGRVSIENDYNYGGMLSCTIQFVWWVEEHPEEGERARVLLQVHGGCDVRGGYSAPVLFDCYGLEGAYELYDSNRCEFALIDREDTIPADQPKLDGTLPDWRERDPLGHFIWRYDAHGGMDREWNGWPLSEPDVGPEWDDPMNEDRWDEDAQAFRAPDGNGYVAVYAPITSG